MPSEEWFRLSTHPLNEPYRVRVHGNDAALADLVEMFPDSDPRIVGIHQDYWLDWSGWTPGLTLNEIVAKGNQLLGRIRGAARLCGLSTGLLSVWYVYLTDPPTNRLRQLIPVLDIYLDLHRTSEERRLLARNAITSSETDVQVAAALTALGEENDWASIRKTLEILSTKPGSQSPQRSFLAKAIRYDKQRLDELHEASSGVVHGNKYWLGSTRDTFTLHEAEWEMRNVVEKWLLQKSGKDSSASRNS